MSINTAISKWIEKSEPDFYTLFIKAWIPYNSWYMHNYADEDANRTSDRDIIEYIKSNPNAYKNKISALLQGSGDESDEFKQLICKLHYSLESNPIPDFDNKISFYAICIRGNSKRQETIQEKTFSVKGIVDLNLPKKDARWVFEIIDNKSMATISRIALHKCSTKELHNNADYISLEVKYKSSVERCLNEINPDKKESVIVQAVRRGSKYSQPANSIVISNNDNLYFIDNVDDVSRAIIHILYELRCKLFHGEIEPTTSNSGIYEQAFYIQRMLIKALN